LIIRLLGPSSIERDGVPVPVVVNLEPDLITLSSLFRSGFDRQDRQRAADPPAAD
jgi:hypothetical protein